MLERVDYKKDIKSINAVIDKLEEVDLSETYSDIAYIKLQSVIARINKDYTDFLAKKSGALIADDDSEDDI